MAKDSNNLNSNRLYVGCSDSEESADSDSDTLAVDSIDTTVPPSYFGNIDVKNSTNIIFGNTVSYNGPVTVQQFVNNGENDTENNIISVDLLANTNGIKPITEVAEKSFPVSFNDKQHPSHLSQQFSIVLAKNEDEDSSSKWKQPRRWFVVAVSSCILIVVTLIVVLAIVLSSAASSTSKKEDTDWENYYKNQTLLNGTEGIAPFYSRADWLAQPVGPGDKFSTQPVPLVIISHSATAPCLNNSQCIFQVRKIQTFHMESQGWRDIGYNFLAGGDGGVYEGRGWDLTGAHAYGYNNISIGICTLGTFIKEVPPQKQIRAVKLLIEEGVRQGKISPRYKLLAHSQVSRTESPGTAYYKVIQTWPHWVNGPNDELPEPTTQPTLKL